MVSDNGKTCEAAPETEEEEPENENEGPPGDEGLDNIHEIKLQASYFSKKRLEISFKFDHFLDNLENLKSKTTLKIKEEGKDDTIDISEYSLELKRTDKSYLVLKISENEPNLQESSINNAEIILTFDHESHLTSDSGQGKARYPRNRLSYRPVSFQKLSLFDSDKEIEEASTLGMAIATGTIIITAPFLGSFMLKLPQFFDFLDFINVNFPSNLAKFLETFDNSFIRMLGHQLIGLLKNSSSKLVAWFDGEKVKMAEAEIGCFPDPKVQENDMGCFLLGNAMGFFIKICAISLLKIIISLFTWCFYKKSKRDNSYFGKFFNYANKKLSLGFFCSLFVALQMDLLLLSFINFRNFYIKKTTVGLISALMSVAIVGFYFTLIIYMIYKTKQLTKSGAKKDKKWEFLVENYKDFNKEKGIRKTAISHFDNLTNIRDFIFPLSVITFLENGKVQITILLLLYSIVVVIACLSLPYERKTENFILVFLEISCLVILAFIAVLLSKQDDWDEDRKAKVIGTPLIWIISTIIGVIILVCLYESVKSVVAFGCWIYRKITKDKKTKKIAKNIGSSGGGNSDANLMFSSMRGLRSSPNRFGISRKRLKRKRNTFKMKLMKDKKIVREFAKIGLGLQQPEDQSNPKRK